MADNINVLNTAGLTHVWSLIVQNFATKEAGKGLSSNDFTNELLSKLNGISDGAEVNVLENVQVNGTDTTIKDKSINIHVPTGALAELDKVGTDQLETAIITLINSKAGKATTLSGYGISDAYEKTEVYTRGETNTAIDDAVKTAIAGIYKIKGSIAFSDLTLTGKEEGYIYNITDAFTTTDDFIEGAGISYPAGTNVVAVKIENKLMWDAMAGTYDFSEYVKNGDITPITTDQIDEICKILAE